MERFTAEMATKVSTNSGNFATCMKGIYKIIANAAENAKKCVDVQRGTLLMPEHMLSDVIVMLQADGYLCNTTNTHLEIKWP